MIFIRIRRTDGIHIINVRYHYRFLRPGSAGADRSWRHTAIIGIHNEIDNELKRMGKYSEYRNVYLQQRLSDFRHRYCNNMQDTDKEAYLRLVQSALTEEDWKFLRSAPPSFPAHIREFYDTME